MTSFVLEGINTSKGGDNSITPRKMNNFVSTIYPEKKIKVFLAHILRLKIPRPKMKEANEVKNTNENMPAGFVMSHRIFASTRLIRASKPITISIYPIKLIRKLTILRIFS